MICDPHTGRLDVFSCTCCWPQNPAVLLVYQMGTAVAEDVEVLIQLSPRKNTNEGAVRNL